MKTKSRKTRATHRQNLAFDLFGEIPVTWDEVYLWCDLVTNGKFGRDKRNFMQYVTGWNVIEKIQHVKASHGSIEHYLKTAANDERY